MTTLSKISTGAIALVGLVALALPPSFAADQTLDQKRSKEKASEAAKPKTIEPLRSDKPQQAIEEKSVKPKDDQGGDRSGLRDLSGGRDSHLGPH